MIIGLVKEKTMYSCIIVNFKISEQWQIFKDIY